MNDGDLIAELLTITADLGGTMERREVYESTGRQYKKIVIEYNNKPITQKEL